MKISLRKKDWLRKLRAEPPGRRRPATRAERGQALIVIAMAMIGLLAFVGLTVDAGILFIAEGHLRRAVDAAALAAAGQFRVGSTTNQLLLSAKEVVHLNGVDPTNLTLGVCLAGDPHNDDTLCPAGNAPHRKLVKVTATNTVTFAFLGIIGIPSTQIVADSVSETASVDVVLVIDTSSSMTFDVNQWSDTFSVPPMQPSESSSYWFPNGPYSATVQDGCNQDPQHKNPDPTYTGYCLPFDQVKHAAVDFVSHLYFPYDRLSIVTFDITPTVVLPINNGLTVTDTQTIIKGLTVSTPRDHVFVPGSCQRTGNPGPDPSPCTNTSTGGGLRLAAGQFGIAPVRQEAVWVVILLTDGAANASWPCADGSCINNYCPSSTWNNGPSPYDPFCRAADKTTRHTALDPNVYNNPQYDPGHTTPYNPNTVYDIANYDSDDYARDNADFVACAAKYTSASKYCRDSLNYTINQGGQGAVIFPIGLGKLVIDNPQGGANADGTRIALTNPREGYAAGDKLLRYIARVGTAGDPNGVDACQSVDITTKLATPPPPTPPWPPIPAPGNQSYSCGNYYYSQTGTGLQAVFTSIASRIFTRITQ